MLSRMIWGIFHQGEKKPLCFLFFGGEGGKGKERGFLYIYFLLSPLLNQEVKLDIILAKDESLL